MYGISPRLAVALGIVCVCMVPLARALGLPEVLSPDIEDEREKRVGGACGSAPCNNGGACTANGTTSFQCTCTPGNWGTTCSMRDACFSDPCQNGATCNREEHNTYTCTCAPGYNGTDCDQAGGACYSGPCLNGGACTDNGTTSFQCTCTPGNWGTTCSMRDACFSDPCQNGATCNREEHNTYTCTCAPGYNGTDCDQAAGACYSSPCLNGGACTDNGTNSFQCTCTPGNWGTTCDKSDACFAGPCQNGATCNRVQHTYNCTCAPGFNGTVCDASVCDPTRIWRQGIEECEATCAVFTSDVPPNITCSGPQLVQCYCPLGLLLDTDGECVSLPECGCWNRGDYRPLNATWLSDDCTVSYTCTPSLPAEVIGVNITGCNSTSEVCQMVDGDYACVCQTGYSASAPDGECTLDPVTECPPLEKPPNGRVVTPDGREYLDMAYYACDRGYVRMGPLSHECNVDLEWTGDSVSCVPLECPTTHIANGNVTTSDGTAYQSVVTYSCDAGYVLSGDQTRKCKYNSQWSGLEPSCDFVKCRKLRPIPNGQVDMPDGRAYQAVATYSCNHKYLLAGSPTRECQSNAQWSDKRPKCISLSTYIPSAMLTHHRPHGRHRPTHGHHHDSDKHHHHSDKHHHHSDKHHHHHDSDSSGHHHDSDSHHHHHHHHTGMQENDGDDKDDDVE